MHCRSCFEHTVLGLQRRQQPAQGTEHAKQTITERDGGLWVLPKFFSHLATPLLLFNKEEEEGGVENNPAILVSPHVPEPVFFCSVEAPSLAQQKQFELALASLAREDPSLRVRQVHTPPPPDWYSPLPPPPQQL
jgi:hypothetical protein